MLDFDHAQQRLADGAQALMRTETVPLAEAADRVLAGALRASVDLPPGDTSAMDGYAIRFADYRPGRPLPVSQRVFAGELPQALPPGHAARVFTGTLMPPGADTVVMQEYAREHEGQVEFLEAPAPCRHARRRGEDIASG